MWSTSTNWPTPFTRPLDDPDLLRRTQALARRLCEDWFHKGLFPPYFLAPVARLDTVAGNPKAVEALDRVDALIDNATMQELNRQVEVDKKEPRAVAAAFLKAKGVLR